MNSAIGNDLFASLDNYDFEIMPQDEFQRDLQDTRQERKEDFVPVDEINQSGRMEEWKALEAAKERYATLLEMNRNLQYFLHQQILVIEQILPNLSSPLFVNAPSTVKRIDVSDEKDKEEREIICSFPITGSRSYFCNKAGKIPKYYSPEHRLISVKRGKSQSKDARKWTTSQESILSRTVLNGLQNQVILGSVPSNEHSRLQRYTTATTAAEKERVFREMLPSLLNQYTWDDVANRVKHSPTDCFVHWINVCDPKINRSAWSMEEEAELLQIAQQNRRRNWRQIAADLNTNRTPFQCLSHYMRCLEMDYKYHKWTEDEDILLKEAIHQLGTKQWNDVCKRIPGRTSIQCCSRYYQSIVLQGKKGRWSELEDKRFLLYLLFYGTDNWSRIATRIITRNSTQCRDRWLNNLRPTVERRPWSTKENKRLLSVCSKHSIIPWKEVCKLFPGRTADSCKTRYHCLHK